MSKLPWFKFNPSDWLTDTRIISPAAKGAWIDLLCAMHRSPTRGIVAMDAQGYARLFGTTPDEAIRLIAELVNQGVCDRDQEDDLTVLVCRRMVREDAKNASNSERQRRHRERVLQAQHDDSQHQSVTSALSNAPSNAGSNAGSNASVTGENKEVRSKKVSTDVDTPPQVTKPAPEVKAHAFERSPFFDKHRFAAEMQSRVPEMTRDEMAYWYGQAEASSNKGNKYKNWVRAILSWRRDKPTQYADWAARNNGGSKPASTYKPATNYTPGGGAQ